MAITISCDRDSDEAGRSVEVGGDYDGDGVVDIVLGAPCAMVDGVQRVGWVAVYSGTTGSLIERIKGEQEREFFGTDLEFVGDVDGDGTDELAVGSQRWDVDLGDDMAISDAGRLTVISSVAGPLYTIEGMEDSANFGQTITATADLDMDMVADFVVNAGGATVGGDPKGIAYLVSAADGSIIDQSDGDVKFDRWGSTLGPIGDVNGDGSADVLIASNVADLPQQENNGVVKVVSGADFSDVIATVAGIEEEKLGRAVGATIDLDADMKPDFFAGSPGFDVGNKNNAGRVRLCSGASGQVIDTFEEPSAQVGAAFGTQLVVIDNIDADQVPDLVASAPTGDSNGMINAGRVHALAGVDGLPLWTIEGERSGLKLGQAMATGADFDGDMINDILIGEPGGAPRGRRGAGGARLVSGADGSVITTLAGKRGRETRFFVAGWKRGRVPQVRGFTNSGRRTNPRSRVIRGTRSGDLTATVVDIIGGSKMPGELRVAVGTGRGSESQRVDILRASRRRRIIASFDGVPDPGYSGGVNVAAGDFDGEGLDEIVVARSDSDDGTVNAAVFKFLDLDPVTGNELWVGMDSFDVFLDTDMFGPTPIDADGANVAVGELRNGPELDDDFEEIVVAPASGLPVVRVLAANGTTLQEWIAYSEDIADGVSVAVGDLDGNGKLEIVTAPASGIGWIKAFDGSDGTPYVPVGSGSPVSFFAFDLSFEGGAKLALADVDLDDAAEILVVPATGMPTEVRAFEADGTPVEDWKVVKPFGPSLNRGTAIAATDRFYRH